MRPIKIVALVLGSLFALAGAGTLFGGLILGWAYGTQRDGDGYFITPTERLETETYAITSEGFDVLLDPEVPDWAASRLGDVLLRADGSSAGIFVGVGPEAEVEAYLAGVAHDEIAHVSGDPFEVRYRREAGEAQPGAPAEQDFWAAQASGAGTQELRWEPETGRWVAVLMNADGSPGVQADVQAGGRSDLLPLAIGALLLGGLLLLGGTALILGGAIGLGRSQPAPAAPEAQPEGEPVPSPVHVEGRLDESLSRWLWLVKWLLAIPHYIVLAFLCTAFVILTAVAGVAILFTGRYPRGIFEFNVGVLRWMWRVGYYSTSAIATDRYPPFTLGPVPDYPATLEVAYPEHLSRGLVLVKWWLLAIPHYLILAVLTSAPIVTWATWDGPDGWRAAVGGGLAGLLVLFAGLVLLFRGRYPTGVHALLMGINRWLYRVMAYASLMTDAYPPFRLDQGATEPGARPAVA